MQFTIRSLIKEYRLVLTGERLRRKHLVIVSGKPKWLQCYLFQEVVDLILKRGETHTGYLPLTPQYAALMGTFGIELQLGDPEEYRLEFEAEYVALDPSVDEIQEHCLCADARERLKKMCKVLSRSVLPLLPRGRLTGSDR